MNDYLGAIAARAFPQSDAIQPRVATRFEPVSPEEAPMFTAAAAGPTPTAPIDAPKPVPPLPLETRFQEIERVVREIVPADRNAGVPPDGPAASSPPPPPRGAETAPRQPARTPALHMHTDHERNAGVPPAGPAAPSPPPPPWGAETAPGQPARAPALHMPVHETHTDRERNAGVPPAGPAASSPPPPARGAGTAPGQPARTPALHTTTRIEHTDRIEHTVHTEREPPLTLTLSPEGRGDLKAKSEPRIVEQRPQILPARVAPPPSPPITSRTPEPAPEPPSVHVTIGRVEIRAALPAEKPRPAAQTQTPSLAEYLRRRDRRSPG